jgi:hypothetical protein
MAEAAIRRLPFVVGLGSVPARMKVESELAALPRLRRRAIARARRGVRADARR